jgi:hypothetical protein
MHQEDQPKQPDCEQQNHQTTMKKSILGICAAALTSSACFGQAVLTDNFDSYNPGDLVGQGGWTQTGSTATNPIQVVNQSGADDAVVLGTSGQDVFKAFTSAVSHTDGFGIQTEFSLLVTSADSTGDYFLHLTSSGASHYQRVSAKSSGSGFVLGLLEASGGTTTFGATELTLGTEYAVDVLWNFVPGDDNDTFALTVDNLPYLAHTWTSTSDEPTTVAAVNLRQGAAADAPIVAVDDLLVSVIPEPASVALLGLGAGVLGIFRRRR